MKIWITLRRNHGDAKLNHRYLRAAKLAVVALLILAGGAVSTIAVADEAPDAFTASPDVYKVIAENARCAWWPQPGNRANVT